ncbi:MAG TPA: metallophosphoesterase family protein [Nitrospirota bacterium]|jgi:diadenosine tetraphosphatase ApaH/serine/threonine PP2A family protein phosphatase
MRTAVISDIHANLEALTAVLERTKALKADELVCLGDMVGYNADPNETLGILRSEKALCVLGNHDACAAGLEEPDDFNPLARAAVFWTRDRLTEKNRQFLAELPRERRVRDFFAFHGSVHDTDRYILYREDAVHNFRLLAGLPNSPLLGFFGHTHLMTALIEQQGTISTIAVTEELELAPGKRYLINPGSVGQPRDGDPRAGFLVYDDRDRRITFHRVEYDIRTCQDKIIRAGLPPRLAERLAWGM